ncbi:hypothetical protein JW859_03400 [bacterium]|nr:hypothetical protein [bacterium]
MRIRTVTVAFFTLLLGLLFASCGGGGGVTTTTLAGSTQSGGSTPDVNANGGIGEKGFSVLPYDFDAGAYDQCLAQVMKVITEDDAETGNVTVIVGLVDATDVCTVFYQLTWPCADYELGGYTAGEFYGDEGINAVTGGYESDYGSSMDLSYLTTT